MPAESKECRRCHETKGKADFYHSKMTADGLQSYCKVCTRLRMPPACTAPLVIYQPGSNSLAPAWWCVECPRPRCWLACFLAHMLPFVCSQRVCEEPELPADANLMSLPGLDNILYCSQMPASNFPINLVLLPQTWHMESLSLMAF